MHAELIFEIPKESTEFMMASWGHKYWAALTEINSALRNHTKHGVCKADTIAAIKNVMDEINPLMEEIL